MVCDGLRWLWLALRSTSAVEAENLFLRRQLALHVERGIKPRRIDSITRIALTILSGFFDWRDALVVVRPQTLIRWHRAGWKLFWRLKSRPGRPLIPAELQALIRRIANENPSWGEERIANELLLKIGIRVSPRTVNKYLPRHPRGRPRGDLRWSTFLRLHAQGIIACDLFVAVTATLKSPPRRPKATAICERGIGTIRNSRLYPNARPIRRGQTTGKRSSLNGSRPTERRTARRCLQQTVAQTAVNRLRGAVRTERPEPSDSLGTTRRATASTRLAVPRATPPTRSGTPAGIAT
jgi:hypothetical protein